MARMPVGGVTLISVRLPSMPTRAFRWSLQAKKAPDNAGAFELNWTSENQ
jgi:hypothetical protein